MKSAKRLRTKHRCRWQAWHRQDVGGVTAIFEHTTGRCRQVTRPAGHGQATPWWHTNSPTALQGQHALATSSAGEGTCGSAITDRMDRQTRLTQDPSPINTRHPNVGSGPVNPSVGQAWCDHRSSPISSIHRQVGRQQTSRFAQSQAPACCERHVTRSVSHAYTRGSEPSVKRL